jgi:predicted Zn-dependent peptidase
MEFFTCKNFRIAYFPTNSKIVNTRVVVNAGAFNEDADSHGVAHFLEHMFFKGTEKRSYKEINKITSRLGSINAYTSRYTTCYHFTFLADDLKESLDVLFDMVFHAAFPEEEFKKEVGVIVEECQSSIDDPMHYFFNNQIKSLLGDEFGHWVIGSRDSILATTPEKLYRFHGRHYNPDNILIAVAGNIDVAMLKKFLEEYLPDIEPNTSNRTLPPLNYEDHTFHHVSKQAIIGFVAPGVTTIQEVENDYMPDIFFNGLGGGMHSLLFDRIREELGLCYHVGAHHNTNELYGIGQIYCLLDEKNVGQAKEEVDKIITRVKSEGLPEDLLEICKRNYLFKFGRSTETSSGLNCQADAFFSLEGYPLSKYISFEEREAKVRAIENDQIIEFANQMFKEKMKFVQMTQEKA